MPVLDSVRLFQSIYRVPKAVFAENLARYSQALQCDGFLQQRVATLSLGQRLRAELLCILIYEPQVLILDEPTLGLDIEGKRQFRDVLRRLVDRQRLSVLITTHDVNDMQKLCSRILMICKGEKVMDVTSGQFEQLLSRHSVLITDCPPPLLPNGCSFWREKTAVAAIWCRRTWWAVQTGNSDRRLPHSEAGGAEAGGYLV